MATIGASSPLFTYGNVRTMAGGEDGTILQTLRDIVAVAGIPVEQFTVVKTGEGWAAFNPSKNAYEQAYRISNPNGGADLFLPESIARQALPGEPLIPALNNIGDQSFDWGSLIPLAVAAFATAGAALSAAPSVSAPAIEATAAIDAGGAFGATEGLGMAGTFESLSAGAVPLTSSTASLLTNAASGAVQGAASGATSTAAGATSTAAGAALATTAATVGKAVLGGVTGAVANALTDTPTADAPTVIAPTNSAALNGGRWIVGALVGTAVFGTVAYIAKRNKK